MPAVVASKKFTFSNGGTGAALTLDSGPAVGQIDLLCINSDTVITDVTGSGAAWVLAESAVTNQGSYIYARTATGGEGTGVTVTTSGNHPTAVTHVRLAGVGTRDTDTSTQANSSAGNSTPAHSTGTLAEADEIAVAFAALHGNGTGNQSGPVWSTGYVSVFDTPAVTGAGSTHSTNFVGYRTGVGTAAEEPSVSWSGDACTDRYILVVTFRRILVSLTGTAPLGELTAAATLTVSAPAPADSGIGGGWYSLISVLSEAQSIAEQEASRTPSACPNDGEPLHQGPNGVLYCPWDGWQYSGA